jgi:hypothetical protein
MLTRLRNSERGFALVMTIGMLLVLGIATTAVIDYSVSNDHHSNRSKADQVAYALAEAGLNNALSVVNSPNNNALSQAILPTSEPAKTDPNYAASMSGGYAKWYGVLSGNQWTLYGVGLMKSPNGATVSDVRRKISAKVNVTASLTQPYNAVAWDYVMSTGNAGGNTCDQTVADGNNTGNPAVVSTRLYVFGNLCLGTNQGGVGKITGSPLHVRGKIFVNEGSSGVGASGTPLTNGVHVAGGCKLLSNTLHTNCSNGNGTDRVWASPIDATPDMTVTAPVADFAGWYTNNNIGPGHPCSTSTGTPPTWDNNGSRDNSVSPTVDLTPASSYTCTSASGAEFSWNASTKTFTIAGTIYIDGSASITNGSLNQYNGQGTLYLSGTFQMTANAKLCGAASGGNCDWNAWNPNTELFGIVANGTFANPAGVSIWLKDGQFQGALYGTGTIRPEGTEQTEGPMIASEVELGYNVSTGSQVASSFPLITTIPAGLPGVPNVHADPQPPTGFTG